MNAIQQLFNQYTATDAYKALPDIPEVTITCEAVARFIQGYDKSRFIQRYDKSAMLLLGERINDFANAHELQGFMRGYSYAMRLIIDSGASGA